MVEEQHQPLSSPVGEQQQQQQQVSSRRAGHHHPTTRRRRTRIVCMTIVFAIAFQIFFNGNRIISLKYGFISAASAGGGDVVLKKGVVVRPNENNKTTSTNNKKNNNDTQGGVVQEDEEKDKEDKSRISTVISTADNDVVVATATAPIVMEDKRTTLGLRSNATTPTTVMGPNNNSTTAAAEAATTTNPGPIISQPPTTTPTISSTTVVPPPRTTSSPPQQIVVVGCQNLSSNTEFTISNYTSRAIVGTNISQFMTMDTIPILYQIANMSRSPAGYATCRHIQFRFGSHFPHFMQQFYRCWSFWQSYPDKISVFLTNPMDINKRWWKEVLTKAFPSGIIKLLPELGIQHVTTDQIHHFIHGNNTTTTTTTITADLPQSSSSISAYSYPGMKVTDDTYQSSSIVHMRSFRLAVLEAFALNDTATHSSTCHSQNSKDDYTAAAAANDDGSQRKGVPRIVMINRPRTRHVLDSQRIREELTSHLHLPYTIPEIYFEGYDLRKQVEQLSTIDILITPHGAVETGIVFMPPPCSSVMEFLPENYYYPNFFGMLAASSGIQHSYLYVGENLTSKEYLTACRDKNFCLSTESVLRGVTQLVDRWHACCNSI